MRRRVAKRQKLDTCPNSKEIDGLKREEKITSQRVYECSWLGTRSYPHRDDGKTRYIVKKRERELEKKTKQVGYAELRGKK